MTQKTKATVLIVEDSPTQALNIQQTLLEMGLDVVCAEDGLAGLRQAQRLLPDLIVLDVQLPEMNGFEVIRELKKWPETEVIPVILLTRHDTPDAVKFGMAYGAIDFIPKDAFAMAVLKETIQQMDLLHE